MLRWIPICSSLPFLWFFTKKRKIFRFYELESILGMCICFYVWIQDKEVVLAIKIPFLQCDYVGSPPDRRTVLRFSELTHEGPGPDGIPSENVALYFCTSLCVPWPL